MKRDKKVVKNMVMSESDMKALQKIADSQGSSVSWLVRQAVKAYLEERK